MIRAKLSYLRISPRKVRLVADLIRGKRVDEAQAFLTFTAKKATEPLLKLLRQAIANAKQNSAMVGQPLYISKIIVNEGAKMKRWRPRARGSAYEIQKKTSHITLTLSVLRGEEKGKGGDKGIDLTKSSTGVQKEKMIKRKKIEVKKKKEVLQTVNKKKGLDIGAKKIFQRKAF